MSKDFFKNLYVKARDSKILPSFIVILVNIFLVFIDKSSHIKLYVLIASIPLWYYIFIIFVDKKFIKGINFYLQYNKGELVDVKLNAKNVALRKSTIQIIFDGLVNNNDLLTIGKSVGNNFGTFLSNSKFFSKIKDKENFIETCLKKWAEYDSTSGMGLFSIENITKFEQSPSGDYKIPTSFNVNIQNFFLDNKHCKFIEGHIECVILEILKLKNVNYKVTVTQKCSGTCTDKICKYTVSLNQ